MRRFAFVPALPVLLALAAGCAKETLAHQQLERDANRIVNLLKASGIDAAKIKDEASRDLRFNVLVPADAVTPSLAILERYNLPKVPTADTRAMFEAGGMIPTNEQQRAKREVGIRGDITNALLAIPRVVDVEVLVTIPEDDPLRDVNEAKPKPKVSVVIVFMPDAEKRPPFSVEVAQNIVQGAVREVKGAEVTITMFPTEDDAKGPAGPIIDPMKGCLEKEKVIGIDVCAGNRGKVVNLLVGAVVIAGLLAGMVIVSVLRAMRYRKDLTRLTAQFEKVKAK